MAICSIENLKLRDELFLAQSQGFLSHHNTMFNQDGYGEKKYENTFIEHEANKPEIEGLKKEIKYAEDELIRLRSTTVRNEKELSAAKKNSLKQTERILQLQLEVSELKKEVSALQEDRDITIPFIQPIVDIRL